MYRKNLEEAVQQIDEWYPLSHNGDVSLNAGSASFVLETSIQVSQDQAEHRVSMSPSSRTQHYPHNLLKEFESAKARSLNIGQQERAIVLLQSRVEALTALKLGVSKKVADVKRYIEADKTQVEELKEASKRRLIEYINQ